MSGFKIKGEEIAGPNRGLFGESAQYVAGRETKAENPHLHRLSWCHPNGISIKLSAYVNTWLKNLAEEPIPPAPGDAELAARLAQLPTPSWAAPLAAYRTHAQRMAQFHAELDRANKRKPPLVWRPISKERAERMIPRSRNDNHAEWTDAARERSAATARKRGDIVCETFEEYAALNPQPIDFAGRPSYPDKPYRNTDPYTGLPIEAMREAMRYNKVSRGDQ